jgi:hypothetical protein
MARTIAVHFPIVLAKMEQGFRAACPCLRNGTGLQACERPGKGGHILDKFRASRIASDGNTLIGKVAKKNGPISMETKHWPGFYAGIRRNNKVIFGGKTK